MIDYDLAAAYHDHLDLLERASMPWYAPPADAEEPNDLNLEGEESPSPPSTATALPGGAAGKPPHHP